MKTLLTVFTFVPILATGAMAADAKLGQAAYEKACKSCHGADGAPNPAIAKVMKVEMRDLKSAEVQATSDADLKSTITNGKGKMKPSKNGSAADADNIVAYIRSLTR